MVIWIVIEKAYSEVEKMLCLEQELKESQEPQLIENQNHDFPQSLLNNTKSVTEITILIKLRKTHQFRPVKTRVQYQLEIVKIPFLRKILC